MNQIKTKLGLILVLLLSVILIVPSASSKYVKQFRTIMMIKSEVASYNLWWNGGHGSTVSSGNMGVADPTAASSIGSDGVITINSTTVPSLRSAGYYMLIAKGGNGGRGINISTGAYTGNETCGYGGVVCGVYYLDPSQTTLKVCLGNNGKDAAKSYTATSAAATAGKNAYTRAWGYSSSQGALCPGAGGAGGGFSAINFTGAGGGAATWIFKDSIDTNNTLLIAAGGAASGSTYDGTSGYGQGGHGGSNVISGGSTATALSGKTGISNGIVYSGITGGGDKPGIGAGLTRGDGGYGASPGGSFTAASASSYIAAGVGGDGAKNDLYGGGGGGGYSGGGGGSTGGGGGSSYVNTGVVDVSSTLVNKASYIATMEDVFNIYFPGVFYYDNNTGMFYTTSDNELERYSFFVLYYISSENPASL